MPKSGHGFVYMDFAVCCCCCCGKLNRFCLSNQCVSLCVCTHTHNCSKNDWGGYNNNKSVRVPFYSCAHNTSTLPFFVGLVCAAMAGVKRGRDCEDDTIGKDTSLEDSLREPLDLLEKLIARREHGSVVLSDSTGVKEFRLPGCAGGFRYSVKRLDFRCTADPREPTDEDDFGTERFVKFIRDDQQRTLEHWTRYMDKGKLGTHVDDVFDAEMRFPKGTVVAIGPGGRRVFMMRCDTKVKIDIFKGSEEERALALERKADEKREAAAKKRSEARARARERARARAQEKTKASAKASAKAASTK
jgi:hypothetical protein